MNLFKNSQTHRHRKQIYCYHRGKGGRDTQKVGNNIYILLYIKWIIRTYFIAQEIIFNILNNL